MQAWTELWAAIMVSLQVLTLSMMVSVDRDSGDDIGANAGIRSNLIDAYSAVAENH
jgi:hypothetical protein